MDLFPNFGETRSCFIFEIFECFGHRKNIHYILGRSWTKLDQKLSYPRRSHLTFLIPEKLNLKCNKNLGEQNFDTFENVLKWRLLNLTKEKKNCRKFFKDGKFGVGTTVDF